MTTPTINQLYTSIIASLESELSITISPFGRSYLRAKAMVQAGRLYLLYLVMAQIQKNIFVDTCDTETLIRFGNVKLGRDPFPATQAKYTVQATGTLGAVIKSQTIFRSNDDSANPGARFILDEDYTLDGINVFTLRALVAGVESQLEIGNQLTAEAPISLVDSIVTVLTESVQPEAAEDIELYRDKVIAAFRLEPQGGAAADYRLWSTEVSGIVQAYPYAKSGYTSEIDLFIEGDTVDGVPSGTDLTNVQESIELPTIDRPARKPVTAIVNYLPVQPLDVAIEIDGFVSLTAAKETLIDNALTEYFSEIRPFVSAIDVVADQNDYFDTNTVIGVILQAVPNSIFDSVTILIEGYPENSYQFTYGEIPYYTNLTITPA
jgi:uncharacterized phage protein gp47/JayE